MSESLKWSLGVFALAAISNLNIRHIHGLAEYFFTVGLVGIPLATGTFFFVRWRSRRANREKDDPVDNDKER